MTSVLFVTRPNEPPTSWPQFLQPAQPEFPTLEASLADDDIAAIDIATWHDPAYSTWEFDRALDIFEDAPLRLKISCGQDDYLSVVHVLNRAQRVIRRRNSHSNSAGFDDLLRAHRAIHSLEKPLVRSDFDHALDVWQWVLRLDPDASFEVQAAALFHDIERLETEADARVEQHAADYQAFKNAHARRGAAIAAALLASTTYDAAVVDRVADLVSSHEVPGDDPELRLLNDADALSFFSFNSSGYFDYYGLEQGEKKVAYTLARLSPAARDRLSLIHLRPDVAAARARCEGAPQ